MKYTKGMFTHHDPGRGIREYRLPGWIKAKGFPGKWHRPMGRIHMVESKGHGFVPIHYKVAACSGRQPGAERGEIISTKPRGERCPRCLKMEWLAAGGSARR